jgi:phage terminase large subunit-like protein
LTVPLCGFVGPGKVLCDQQGDHLCATRGNRIVKFFADALVHTKSDWAGKPFILADWQEHGIVRPLFGTVLWDPDAGRYVRRYRIAWIELARKQGKSELLAGFALYLLLADGEAGAEVYGCAEDRDQARKVFDVALRMTQLSRPLGRRITAKEHAKRLVDEETASYYEIVAADASGNLGHNPHGVIFDEVVSQPNSGLWTAMRTGMGSRSQPMMVAATTAGTEDDEFCKRMHDEMLRVAEDPERARHVFVYMRNTPADADPWDEANWVHPNPALGDFMSLRTLRDEAKEAYNDPFAENGFRQFRLNQWVRQASRWMPMHLWDQAAGVPWPTPDHGRAQLAGRTAFCGFDLAAKFDLTAWCVALPWGDPGDEAPTIELLWRFWLPEEGLPRLDHATDGKWSQWAADGWLTVTDGAVVDYERVYADIAADAEHFTIRYADADEWSMWPVIQRIGGCTGLDPDAGDLAAYKNTYDRMSPGLTDLMGMVRQNRLIHHGNPVARACFEAVEVRKAPYDPNLIRPDKPERGKTARRIDAVPTAAMALNAWRRSLEVELLTSAYEDSDLMIV